MMMMMLVMMVLNSWPGGRADSDQGRDVPTQAGALHGTVQALVQSVTISLQHLCCIFAIFVHNICKLCAIFLQYVCNISYHDVLFIFSCLFGKEEPYFSKFIFALPCALCSSFCVKFCPILWGTVANGQCPPSNLLIHTSRFQVFDDTV